MEGLLLFFTYMLGGILGATISFLTTWYIGR